MPISYTLSRLLKLLEEAAPAAEDTGQLALKFGKRFPVGEEGLAAASKVKTSDAALDALVEKLEQVQPERLPLQKTRQLDLFPQARTPRTGADVSRQGTATEIVGPDLAPAVENAIQDVIAGSKRKYPGSVGKTLETSKTTEPGQIQEVTPVEKMVSPEDLQQSAYGLILKRQSRGELPDKPQQLYNYLYPKLRKMADFQVKDMIEPVTVPSAERVYSEVAPKLEKILSSPEVPSEADLMKWLKNNVRRERIPKSLGEVLESRPKKISLDARRVGEEGESSSLGELLPDREELGLSPEMLSKLDEAKKALLALPERQRTIVSLVLGLDDAPMSKPAVAKMLNITRQGVDIAMKRAIQSLRNVLGNQAGNIERTIFPQSPPPRPTFIAQPAYPTPDVRFPLETGQSRPRVRFKEQ